MPGLPNGPQNAQDFIRALKAPFDPPQPGGPLKIDIARLAWDNAQLYVPNKSEAIVEWLLSRLLKDKSKARYVHLVSLWSPSFRLGRPRSCSSFPAMYALSYVIASVSISRTWAACSLSLCPRHSELLRVPSRLGRMGPSILLF